MLNDSDNLDECNKDISVLKDELSKEKKEKSDLLKVKENLEGKIISLEKSNTDLKKSLEDANQKINILLSNNKRLENLIAKISTMLTESQTTLFLSQSAAANKKIEGQKAEHTSMICIFKTEKEKQNCRILGEEFEGGYFVKLLDLESDTYLKGDEVVFDKKGLHPIKVIIDKSLKSFRKMFEGCENLCEVSGNLDTSGVIDFSFMFNECYSLVNIEGLSTWDVSKGLRFKALFSLCVSLSDISALKDWRADNGINFGSTFWGCSSLKTVAALKNWKVGKATNLSGMFYLCSKLATVEDLKSWDVHSCEDFRFMFFGCALENLYALSEWKLEKGKWFKSMAGNMKFSKDKLTENLKEKKGILSDNFSLFWE